MPTQVDERVVSMKFDNADFEKRSRDTLKSLQQLDNATSKMDGAKGLRGLARAAKEVDLSHIEKQASALEVKFSALQVVAITTLQRITNAAIDAGKNIAKSLTIQPIATGFNEYELKMGSIQTIMAGTGESIETVNKYLEELNEYSDRTIYSFSDMTQSIGKFTNAGVKLDKAVAAIKGVSNVAAVSGANANEASRAMYNFAQALSAGYVKLVDWKSIELANMATVEFKNQLLDTAVGLGTVTKTADGMYKTLKGNVFNATKNFNEVLGDQWMTTDVLVQTLSKYADEATEIGKKAYASAQDVKTFTMLLDTLKEAAQSGWAQSYELIVGNFEEAKTLWTSVNNIISGIISESANERNEMLKEWKALGGRDSAIKALGAAWEAFASIITPIRDAFREMFPRATGQQLLEMTEKFREFTESLKLSEESAYTLKVAVKALLLPFRILFKIAELGIYILLKLTSTIWKIIDAIIAIPSQTSKVNGYLKDLLGDKRYAVAANALSKIVNSLAAPFRYLASAIKSVWDILSGSDSDDSVSFLTDLKNLLSPIKNTFLDGVVNTLAVIAGVDLIPTEKSVQNLGSTTSSTTDSITSKFEKIFGLFSKKTDTTGLDQAAKSLSAVEESAGSLVSGGIVDNIKSGTSNIVGFLTGVGDAAMVFVRKLTPAKILIFSFGVAIVKLAANSASVVGAFSKAVTLFSKSLSKGLVKALKGVESAFKSFGSLMKAFKSNIMASGFAKLALAIGILTAALIAISMVDTAKVGQAIKVTLGLMAAMTVMVAALALIERFIAKDDMNSTLNSFALTIGAIAVSVLLLVKSMNTISAMSVDSAFTGFIAVMSLMGILIGSAAAIDAFAPAIGKSAAAIFAMAGAVSVMIKALGNLAKVDLSGVKDNFGYMLLIAGLIGALSLVTRKIKIKSAIGLTILIMDYIGIALALEMLAHFNMEKLYEGLVKFIPVLLAFAAMAVVASKITSADVKGIFALMPMAFGVLSLAGAIRLIGAIDTGVLARGAVVVSALLGVFALITGYFKINKGENTAKMAANFVAMGIAIMALSVSVKYLGKLELGQIIKGVAAVTALMTFMSILLLATGQARKVAGSILALTVCIGTLATAMALLSLMPSEELIPAAISLGVVLVALSTSIGLLGSLGGTFKSAIPSIVAMGLLIGAFTICMLELNKIDKIEEGLGILAGMTLIMVGLGVFCSKVKTISIQEALPTMAVMVILLAEVGLTMAALQLVQTEGALEKASAISIIMVALTTSMGIISKIGATFDLKTEVLGTLAMMAAILASCGVALGILGSIQNLEGLIEKASTLSILMIGLSTATLIISQFHGTVGTAIQGVLAMGVFLTAVSGVIAILGKIATEFESTGAVLDAGIAILVKIGEGIGKFVGSLIGGFTDGLVSGGLENVANQMVAFMNAFSSFIEQVKVVDDSIFEKTTLIADMVGVISGIQYQDTPQMTIFGAALPAFGQCIAGYYAALSTVQDYLKGNSITLAFSKLVESLPNDFSAIDTIKSATFALGMSALGSGIASYYNAVNAASIDETVIDTATTYTKKVLDMLNSAPKSGGLVAKLLGSSDPTQFPAQMAALGNGIRSYYATVVAQGADYRNLDGAISATKDIINTMNELPLTGGKLQWLFGQKDISGFAGSLSSLGNGVYGFYTSITSGGVSIDKEVMVNAAEGLASVIDSIDGIDSTGSIFEWFTGKKDISGFASQLKDLGKGVVDFYTAIVGGGVFVDGSEAPSSTAGFDKIMEFITLVQSLSDAIKAAREDVKIQARSLVTALEIEIRAKYSDIQYAGEYLMDGFVKGIENKQSEANVAMQTFANGVINTTKAGFDEHSPSKVFQQIGVYVVKGFCNGIKATQAEANNGMVKMGVGILKATQTYFKINSPSALMRDEVGVWIVKGIAEGITADMSAEQVAEKKGENIKKAFQAGMDRIQLNMKTDDLELQLWKAMNPNTSQKDTMLKEQEKLKKDLGNLAEKTNTAQAQYQTAKQEFGEQATQTQKFYNEYVSQKTEFVNTANQLIESLGNTEQQQTARMVYFAQELAANQENLLKAGFTMEQIKAAISERTGYNLNGAANAMQNEFSSLDAIISKYLVDADVTIEQSVAASVSKGFAKGSNQAAATNAVSAQNVANSYIQSTVDAVNGGNWDAVSGAVSQNFEGSWAASLDGFIDGLGNKLDAAKEAGKKLFGAANNGVKEEGNINSPSRVMYQNGVWLVEGLINGINASAPLAYEAMANLVNGSASTYSNAGYGLVNGMGNGVKEGEVNTIGVMTGFLKNVLSSIDSDQQNFYNSGNNLTKQLCNGMQEGFTTYFDVVTNAVTSALKELETEVKIRAESIAQTVNQAISSTAQIGIGENITPVVYSSGGGGEPVSVGKAPIKTPASGKGYTSSLASATRKVVGGSFSGGAIGKVFGAAAALAGSTIVNFTQNNTSPKALSRTEIYRDTKNATARLASSINNSKTLGGRTK